MEITENKKRVGFFTSSGIAALMTVSKDRKSFGAPALTYIEEKRMEKRLGRSLNTEISAKPTSWGKLVENRVFELLGLEYKLSSQETFVHPAVGNWSGSPDGNKFDEGKTVFDIKSPWTMKSFCQLADSKTIEELRENHKEGDTYYWQLVSNAILTDSKFAELIVYCPYKSELEAIREYARNYDGADQNKFAFINWAQDNELPFLMEGGHYKNLNIIRFEVPQADKDLLTEKVIAAGRLL